MGERVGFLIAYHILIGGDGLVGLVQATIALGQFLGPFATGGALLAGCLGIGLAILGSGIVVFAHSPELIALFHSLIGPTATKQQGTHYYIYISNEISHFYCLPFIIYRRVVRGMCILLSSGSNHRLFCL